MIDIASWLQAQAWKLATAGAGVVAIGLGVALVVEKFEHSATEKQRAELYADINDPATGYIVRLAQVRTNFETCSASLVTQNKAIDELAKTSTAALAEADQKLDIAQENSRRANARVSELMKPLAGVDTCARSIEMFDRIKKDLAQ